MLVESWPIDRVKPYERNPRVNDGAVDAVAKSLAEFGFRQPLVVDTEGVLIVGHTRWKAAKQLGLTEVPVHVARDLEPEAVRAYRIADNKTGEIAEWDFDLLPIELQSLGDVGYDLGLLGFDKDELAKLLDPGVQEGLTDPDDVPDPPDDPVTQKGDLWILGDHRLLCGDSSSPADVDRLLGGQQIHLVNSDPPYNVKVEPRSKNAIAAGLSSFANNAASSKLKNDQGNAAFTAALQRKKGKAAGATTVADPPARQKMRAKDRPLANDFVTDDEFDRLLDSWFGNMARVLVPGGSFYVWGGYANIGNYPAPLKRAGLYFSQAIVWNKMHPVLTRKDFMGAHELCQPPETQVMTPSGTSKLESLRDGDRVVSFYSHSSAIVGLRQGLEVRVAQRPYRGNLYGVAVDRGQSWSTDGHIWTVRMTTDYPKRWCVYLMRRGAWWRVGITKMRTTWGFGLKGRLIHELGDEAWILSLHDSHADARIQEQLVSVQFGIPQTCWVPSKLEGQRSLAHVDRLYACIDPQELEQAACRTLETYHRDRRYPFLERNQTRAKFGARQSIQVRACNLIPEIMEVPVPIGGPKVQWQRVRAIDVQHYCGNVHSMAVDRHEHYVADGIVTHNCFYGWKEGAGHKFYGPNNATDLWNVKKIPPQQLEHLTGKPAELAVRAIQYSSLKGHNVLDLFGGSGSTLIGAEQTGRRAFLMELDQAYCDVIVDRYQRFTGKPAVLERTGESPIPMRPREAEMR